MEQTESMKTCRSCGEDLRHKRRRKSRDGTYFCPRCIKSEDRCDRRVLAKLTDQKSKLLLFYAVLAAIVGMVIWYVIDIISNLELPPL